MNQHVAVVDQIPSETRIDMRFEDNRNFSSLCGDIDRNLRSLEKRLGVEIATRGNRLRISGDVESSRIASATLTLLYESASKGDDIRDMDIESAIGFAREDGSPRKQAFARIATRKMSLQARNRAQDAYLLALRKHDLTFGVGPAGTGKTYLAVAHAAAMLEKGETSRIVLTRPAVEAGEKLGFLPGDLKDKVDPYLRPLYDALFDMIGADQVDRHIASGAIEVAPLAFMRGRTLSNAVVILDEAQNTTSSQMKMFLTRLGDNACMIVTGDPTQVDLPRGEKSGLAEALELLSAVEGVAVNRFGDADVVRHALVGRIVRAYDKAHAA